MRAGVDAKRAAALALKACSLLHRCFLAFWPGYVKALTSTNYILRRSLIYYAKHIYASNSLLVPCRHNFPPTTPFASRHPHNNSRQLFDPQGHAHAVGGWTHGGGGGETKHTTHTRHDPEFTYTNDGTEHDPEVCPIHAKTHQN